MRESSVCREILNWFSSATVSSVWNNVFYSFLSNSAKSAKSVGKNKTRALLFDVDALAIAASILEKRIINRPSTTVSPNACINAYRHSKRGAFRRERTRKEDVVFPLEYNAFTCIMQRQKN